MPASPPSAFPAPGAAPAPALDAARERVVGLLTDRYADESLTVEQFEAELERMHALRSVAALEAMARELGVPRSLTAPTVAVPGLANVADMRVGVPGSAFPPAPAWPQVAPPERVFAVMTSTKRTGAWVVPPQLRVVCVMSEVTLDLRGALLPPVCEVAARVIMGTLTLWLPPGARGELAVTSFMADVSDRRARTAFAAGPVVRVTGSVVMGEVKLRREDW